MGNLKHKLSKLNFHDSRVNEIRIYQDDEMNNCCEISISYYNWEENDDVENWNTKELRIKFGVLAYLKFDTPYLETDSFTIFDVDFDEELNKYLDLENMRMKKDKNYKSPLFSADSDYLSIKFIVAGIKDEFEDRNGSIHIIGNKVTIEGI